MKLRIWSVIAVDFPTVRSVITSKVQNSTVWQCGVSEFSVCDSGAYAKGLTYELGDMEDGGVQLGLIRMGLSL